jgi:hypothetical protein
MILFIEDIAWWGIRFFTRVLVWTENNGGKTTVTWKNEGNRIGPHVTKSA